MFLQNKHFLVISQEEQALKLQVASKQPAYQFVFLNSVNIILDFKFATIATAYKAILPLLIKQIFIKNINLKKDKLPQNIGFVMIEVLDNSESAYF